MVVYNHSIMCQEIVKGKQCKRPTEPYCYQHGKTISSKKNIADSNIYTAEPTDMSPLSQTATEPLNNMKDMQDTHEVKVVEVESNERIYSVDDTSEQITQKKYESDGTASTINTRQSDTNTIMNKSQDKTMITFDLTGSDPASIPMGYDMKKFIVNNPPVGRIYKLLILFRSDWFRNHDNMFKLVGYFRRQLFTNEMRQLQTFLNVLYKMNKQTFDLRMAACEWNTWTNQKWISKFGEKEIKSIAGGTNPEKYAKWKVHYDPDLPKESTTEKTKPEKTKPLDILRDQLITICKDKYRRVFQSGVIYERKQSYYYTRKYDDPAVFLNHIFNSNQLYIGSGSAVHKELIYFIKNIGHPEFEFMEINYNYIGFNNGIYDLSTATFCPSESIDSTVQVRVYFDEPFVLRDAPYLDEYLNFQFDPEVITFVYFLIGRLMTRLDDNFDFMVLLYGEGGSGKSLIVKLLMAIFGVGQVGILSSTFQGTFGLCEFTDKQIVCSDDMPKNMAKTLERSQFLSMMTRGALSCPVKQKGSIPVDDWNIPTIINSNSLPNYSDESGEIIRRVMIINFEKVISVEKKNTNLKNDIMRTELPTFIHRCRSTYIQYKNQYKGKGVETFCPQVFLDNQSLLRLDINKTSKFINEQYQYKEGASIQVSDLNQKFKQWIKERFELKKMPSDRININSIIAVDSRYKHIKLTICKHCEGKHLKDCCSNYNRTERTTRETIIGLVRKFNNE